MLLVALRIALTKSFILLELCFSEAHTHHMQSVRFFKVNKHYKVTLQKQPRCRVMIIQRFNEIFTAIHNLIASIYCTLLNNKTDGRSIDGRDNLQHSCHFSWFWGTCELLQKRFAGS